jgi:hypothetical protein
LRGSIFLSQEAATVDAVIGTPSDHAAFLSLKVMVL